MRSFCLDCGEPSEGARCPRHMHELRVGRYESDRPYNQRQWRRLSARAREIQPWCTDCGTTTDLTTDHSSQAWEAYEQTGSVPMTTVQVVCRGCNTRRGAARWV